MCKTARQKLQHFVPWRWVSRPDTSIVYLLFCVTWQVCCRLRHNMDHTVSGLAPDTLSNPSCSPVVCCVSLFQECRRPKAQRGPCHEWPCTWHPVTPEWVPPELLHILVAMHGPGDIQPAQGGPAQHLVHVQLWKVRHLGVHFVCIDIFVHQGTEWTGGDGWV